MILFAIIVSLVALPGICTTGWDVSYTDGEVSTSVFTCLRNDGYVFGFVEATAGSNGLLNPNCAKTVANAHSAGIPNVDVYIFPNVSSNAAQMTKTIVQDLINSKTLSRNMIWFDIENPSLWTVSLETNIRWLLAAVNQAESMYSGCGASTCVGIHTNETQWNTIMGGSTAFSGLQLWYANYDNNPSFSGYKPFSGWSKPAIKQYVGNAAVCGTQIGKDYY